jgi:hypothetical protein
MEPVASALGSHPVGAGISDQSGRSDIARNRAALHPMRKSAVLPLDGPGTLAMADGKPIQCGCLR